MVLLMAVSFSFAQMKNVKEAKSIANDVKPNFKQAEQLIEEAMKNPETKDLADTWDVAGFIQKRINEEQMKNAFLKKPYDTLKVYNSILKMYEYYNKCDDLAQVPNEKGKIKNKYRWRMIIKCKFGEDIVKFINGMLEEYNKYKKNNTKISIALNPSNMS